MSLKNLSVKNKIPKILIEKLDNKKVNLLYKKFDKSFYLDEFFIVAVSGGSDSLALAYLSKIYATINNLRTDFFGGKKVRSPTLKSKELTTPRSHLFFAFLF